MVKRCRMGYSVCPPSCTPMVTVVATPLPSPQEIDSVDAATSVCLHVANVNVGRSNRLTRVPARSCTVSHNPASRRGLLFKEEPRFKSDPHSEALNTRFSSKSLNYSIFAYSTSRVC